MAKDSNPSKNPTTPKSNSTPNHNRNRNSNPTPNPSASSTPNPPQYHTPTTPTPQNSAPPSQNSVPPLSPMPINEAIIDENTRTIIQRAVEQLLSIIDGQTSRARNNRVLLENFKDFETTLSPSSSTGKQHRALSKAPQTPHPNDTLYNNIKAVADSLKTVLDSEPTHVRESRLILEHYTDFIRQQALAQGSQPPSQTSSPAPSCRPALQLAVNAPPAGGQRMNSPVSPSPAPPGAPTGRVIGLTSPTPLPAPSAPAPIPPSNPAVVPGMPSSGALAVHPAALDFIDIEYVEDDVPSD